jgi:hypothetical protein
MRLCAGPIVAFKATKESPEDRRISDDHCRHTSWDFSSTHKTIACSGGAHLGQEIGIGRELEALHPVRLKPEGPPDPLHRRD